jgi:hypothetical protein
MRILLALGVESPVTTVSLRKSSYIPVSWYGRDARSPKVLGLS